MFKKIFVMLAVLLPQLALADLNQYQVYNLLKSDEGFVKVFGTDWRAGTQYPASLSFYTNENQVTSKFYFMVTQETKGAAITVGMEPGSTPKLEKKIGQELDTVIKATFSAISAQRGTAVKPDVRNLVLDGNATELRTITVSNLQDKEVQLLAEQIALFTQKIPKIISRSK